jgi:hypothetical protein
VLFQFREQEQAQNLYFQGIEYGGECQALNVISTNVYAGLTREVTMYTTTKTQEIYNVHDPDPRRC